MGEGDSGEVSLGLLTKNWDRALVQSLTYHSNADVSQKAASLLARMAPATLPEAVPMETD